MSFFGALVAVASLLAAGASRGHHGRPAQSIFVPSSLFEGGALYDSTSYDDGGGCAEEASCQSPETIFGAQKMLGGQPPPQRQTFDMMSNEVGGGGDYADEADAATVKRTVATGCESLMALAASAPVSWAAFPNSGAALIRSPQIDFETRKPNCTCKPREMPKHDMGVHHYPRYLDDYACDEGSCPPSFHCREIKYKVWVLKQRQNGDLLDRHAPMLPERLREIYMFKSKHLSAGCECFKRCNSFM